MILHESKTFRFDGNEPHLLTAYSAQTSYAIAPGNDSGPPAFTYEPGTNRVQSKNSWQNHSGDPDPVVWYEYDGFGNLWKQHDAGGTGNAGGPGNGFLLPGSEGQKGAKGRIQIQVNRTCGGGFTIKKGMRSSLPFPATGDRGCSTIIRQKASLSILAAQLNNQEDKCLGFVIMPEHVHALVRFKEKGLLSTFVNQWKRRSAISQEIIRKQAFKLWGQDRPRCSDVAAKVLCL